MRRIYGRKVYELTLGDLYSISRRDARILEEKPVIAIPQGTKQKSALVVVLGYQD